LAPVNVVDAVVEARSALVAPHRLLLAAAVWRARWGVRFGEGRGQSVRDLNTAAGVDHLAQGGGRCSS